MCAFHYWLALITKPFQAVGNNGFRRQLNCPARFARDSLIGMQHFTCAFSPTIGCHAPLLLSQTLRNLLRHVWTNDSTLYFECEIGKEISGRKFWKWKGSNGRGNVGRLVGFPCEIWGTRSGARDFGKFSARLASLMIDHIKGLAVTRLGYNLYR